MVKTPFHKGCCALIVDDEPYIRSSLFRIFEREGIHCLLAGNSEDALVFLKKRRISVVFSDVVIPGGSGIAFLSEVKKRYPMISRICLSGRADKKVIESAIQNGVISHFLSKPWSNTVLKKTLHLALADFARKSQVRQISASKKGRILKATRPGFYPNILLAGESR